MKSLPEFEPMLGKEEGEPHCPLESHPPRKPTILRQLLLGGLCFLAGGLASVAVLWLLHGSVAAPARPGPPHTPAVDSGGGDAGAGAPYVPTHRCGQTADEARARGCVLNLANYAWVPRDCYDAELVRETVPGWTWFRDFDMTRRVPHAEVLRGELLEFFQPFSQHEKHCVYIWKRLYRSTLGGGSGSSIKLEQSGAASYPHVEHCGRVLTRDNSTGHLSVTVAKGQIIFPKC